MIHLEVKHDSRSKWHRLSVGFHDGMTPTPRHRELEFICMQYLLQYAIDNQINPDMVALRTIDRNGNVLFTRVSNAKANEPHRYR